MQRPSFIVRVVSKKEQKNGDVTITAQPPSNVIPGMLVQRSGYPDALVESFAGDNLTVTLRAKFAAQFEEGKDYALSVEPCSFKNGPVV
jgi:hypothetical protein